MKTKIVITQTDHHAHEYFVPTAVAKAALNHAAINLQVGQRALLYVDEKLEAAAVHIATTGTVKVYPNRASLIAAVMPTASPLSVIGRSYRLPGRRR